MDCWHATMSNQDLNKKICSFQTTYDLGLSMNILCAGNKSPVQKGFFNK